MLLDVKFVKFLMVGRRGGNVLIVMITFISPVSNFPKRPLLHFPVGNV